MADLRLLDIASHFIDLPQGLILVTGPTGSGKSTTLAALVGTINDHPSCHIITIEDPIEYVHSKVKAIVDHRDRRSTRGWARRHLFPVRPAGGVP
jgi:twitching motility protein PilT